MLIFLRNLLCRQHYVSVLTFGGMQGEWGLVDFF